MGKQFITSVAIAALLASTPGCFTVIGTGIGALSHGPDKPKPKPQPRVVVGPPGGQSDPYSFATVDTKDDTGMSSTSKGFLIGGAIDLALLGLFVYAASNLDFSWCEDTCSD